MADRITAETLEAKGACSDQVATFRRHWPDGARPLLRTIRKAARLGLDLDWFAEEFLSAPARQEYEKARTQAWREYEKATAPALYAVIKEYGLEGTDG